MPILSARTLKSWDVLVTGFQVPALTASPGAEQLCVTCSEEDAGVSSAEQRGSTKSERLPDQGQGEGKHGEQVSTPPRVHFQVLRSMTQRGPDGAGEEVWGMG